MMDKENLGEWVADRFMVECKDCLHGENLKNDCPHLDEDVCLWQRELSDEILSHIFPIIKAEVAGEIESMLNLHENELGFIGISNHVSYSDWDKLKSRYLREVNHE